MEKVDFSGKTVVHTTTCGTQVIHRAENAREVIIGSFLNARAIENYIKKKDPKTVSLVCSEDFMEEEDNLYSNRLVKEPSSKHSAKDFYMCLELDRFNFVLKAERFDKENFYLKKIRAY